MKLDGRIILVGLFNLSVCAFSLGIGLNYGVGSGLMTLGFCYMVIIGLIL